MKIFKKIKLWYYKRKLKQGLNALRNFDRIMIKAGITRQDRRRLWREVSNSEESRTKVFDKIKEKTKID